MTRYESWCDRPAGEVLPARYQDMMAGKEPMPSPTPVSARLSMSAKRADVALAKVRR